MNLFAGLEEIVTENVPLANFTWLKIGGPARYFVQPRSEEELIATVRRCQENDFAWRILGHGANLLIDDKGVNCAVIKLDNAGFGQMQFVDEHTVKAGGAAPLASLVLESVRRGMTGAEALAGIPGSLGGATKMNAGGRWGDIGTLITKIRVVDSSGSSFCREKPELTFEYRWSNVYDQIVTELELELVPDDPKRVLNKMREVWIVKKSGQPLSSRSAGCVFKNPSPQRPAGALIDKAGLKGVAEGRAKISEQHANFIIAEADARFSDVVCLIEKMRVAVYEKYGLDLDLEIEIWED